MEKLSMFCYDNSENKMEQEMNLKKREITISIYFGGVEAVCWVNGGWAGRSGARKFSFAAAVGVWLISGLRWNLRSAAGV